MEEIKYHLQRALSSIRLVGESIFEQVGITQALCDSRPRFEHGKPQQSDEAGRIFVTPVPEGKEVKRRSVGLVRFGICTLQDASCRAFDTSSFF